MPTKQNKNALKGVHPCSNLYQNLIAMNWIMSLQNLYAEALNPNVTMFGDKS